MSRLQLPSDQQWALIADLLTGAHRQAGPALLRRPTAVTYNQAGQITETSGPGGNNTLTAFGTAGKTDRHHPGVLRSLRHLTCKVWRCAIPPGSGSILP